MTLSLEQVLLWAVAVVAVASFGFAIARTIRTFGWVQPLLHRGVKPFACNLCMGVWGTLAASLVLLAIASSIYPLAAYRDWAMSAPAALEDWKSLFLDGLWTLPAVWWPAWGFTVMGLDRYSGVMAEVALPPMPSMED